MSYDPDYGGIYEDGRPCPECGENNMAENACGTPGNDMCNDCCPKMGGCGLCEEDSRQPEPVPHDFEMYLELVARLRESVAQVHSPVRVCIEDILEEIDSTDHDRQITQR